MTAGQLRIARGTLGLTQYKLAEYLGIQRTNYQHWERGAAPVPPHISDAISDALIHAKKMRAALAKGGQRYWEYRGPR